MVNYIEGLRAHRLDANGIIGEVLETGTNYRDDLSSHIGKS